MAPGVHLQGQGQWGGCPSPPPPPSSGGRGPATSGVWGVTGLLLAEGGGGEKGRDARPGSAWDPPPHPGPGVRGLSPACREVSPGGDIDRPPNRAAATATSPPGCPGSPLPAGPGVCPSPLPLPMTPPPHAAAPHSQSTRRAAGGARRPRSPLPTWQE